MNVVVYIASPYRSDSTSGRLYNIGMARQYCRLAVQAGFVPVAPHLFYPQFLDDNDRTERAQGLEMALGDLAACDELWVFGEPSEGMQREIDLADSLEMPIRFFPSEAELVDVMGVVGAAA